MKRPDYFNLIFKFILMGCFILSISRVSLASEDEDDELEDSVDSEITRLAGFKEHKEDEKIFDQERERGRVAYDEQLEQEAIQYKKDLDDYRKDKKQEIVPELTEDYRDQIEEKKQDFLDHDEIEKLYAKKTKIIRNQLAKRLISEEEELGLTEKTERIDYKKRMLYGAKPNFKSMRKDSTSSSGSGYESPVRSSTVPNFPPPQEDFSDTGFIPPPPMPEPFDPGNSNFPPPPAMPDFSEGEFPPPPPPPTDFGDF